MGLNWPCALNSLMNTASSGCYRYALVAFALLGIPGRAGSFDGDIKVFLTTFCRDCHADGSSEGGLDLDALGQDLSQPQVFASWERLYDRVAEAEMPPPDSSQPSHGERERFVAQLRQPLRQAHASVKGTTLRRLNRKEYQNTLNDLFGTHLDLASMLPEDGQTREFDNVGEGLSVSSDQMQSYLDAAEAV